MKDLFLIVMVFLYAAVNPALLHGETTGQNLPYFDEVTRIMAPLEYSGIDNILGKDVNLSVDIIRKTWTLHNAYHFTDDGNIVLTDGNKGLCGSLSRHVYSRIKTVFPPDRYEIHFAKVKERNFFFTPQATHIIITVFDKESRQEYLIDPSFKRYGRTEDYDDYVFFEREDPDVFIGSNQSPDKFFNIDSAAPIMIRNDHLLLFSVESVDGKIDGNNFVISISAMKRMATESKYLLGLRFINGNLQTYSDDQLIGELLMPGELERFKERLIEWSEFIKRI